jgi:hypothetical protein
MLVTHTMVRCGCSDENTVSVTAPDPSSDKLIVLATGSDGSVEMEAFTVDGGSC